MRNSIAFDDCPKKIDAFLDQAHADRDDVYVTRDTGAHYRLKLVTDEANVIFFCNAVTEMIEITKVTPGGLALASK